METFLLGIILNWRKSCLFILTWFLDFISITAGKETRSWLKQSECPYFWRKWCEISQYKTKRILFVWFFLLFLKRNIFGFLFSFYGYSIFKEVKYDGDECSYLKQTWLLYTNFGFSLSLSKPSRHPWRCPGQCVYFGERWLLCRHASTKGNSGR